MSYCPACGAANVEGARFCEKCGVALAATDATPAVPPSAPVPASASPARATARVNPLLLVLVVVALVAAGVAFVLLKPMSEDEYEDVVDDLAGDIYNAQSDIDGALYTMYFSIDSLENDPDVPSTDQELDFGEVDDARQEFDDGVPEALAAAEKLAGLRAPKRYADEQEDLVAWSEYVLEMFDDYEDLIVDAERGMTYADFSYRYDEISSEDGEREWNGYWDAAEKLHIN